jgi:Coenzyme PQQ synthesis protein D (PqqD)
MWQQVGDEVVLLDADGGEYHGLDDVGSNMWKALEESPDVATAFVRLRDTYEVDEQTLRDDLAEFVERLVALGLLATP